jgi:hypothetical protein
MLVIDSLCGSIDLPSYTVQCRSVPLAMQPRRHRSFPRSRVGETLGALHSDQTRFGPLLDTCLCRLGLGEGLDAIEGVAHRGGSRFALFLRGRSNLEQSSSAEILRKSE